MFEISKPDENGNMTIKTTLEGALSILLSSEALKVLMRNSLENSYARELLNEVFDNVLAMGNVNEDEINKLYKKWS